MNLFVRLLTMLFTLPLRSKLKDPDEGCALNYLVWPTDLDMFFHMNNARYLTFMEIARWDLLARVGLLSRALRERWVMPIASAQIRYMKPLHLFMRFTVRTRILYADDRNMYFHQRFMRGDQVYAVGTVRLAFLVGGQRKSPAELLAKYGFRPSATTVPPLVEKVQAMEAAVTGANAS